MYLINDIDYNCVTAFVQLDIYDVEKGISRHQACRPYFSLRINLFKYQFLEF